MSIHEKVRQAVAGCIPENTVLRIGPVAARIAGHAEEGISPKIVAQELLEAGVAAGADRDRRAA
jgi:hypothetical protein